MLPDHPFAGHIQCDIDPAEDMEVRICGTNIVVSPSVMHLIVSELDHDISYWYGDTQVWTGMQISGEAQVCGFARTTNYPRFMQPLGVDCTKQLRWMCVCLQEQVLTSSPTSQPTTNSPTTLSPTTASPTTEAPTPPTTISPSVTPTTAAPTTSPSKAPSRAPTPPTTRSPSVSPTTSAPTVSPSKTPSVTPSSSPTTCDPRIGTVTCCMETPSAAVDSVFLDGENLTNGLSVNEDGAYVLSFPEPRRFNLSRETTLVVFVQVETDLTYAQLHLSCACEGCHVNSPWIDLTSSYPASWKEVGSYDSDPQSVFPDHEGYQEDLDLAQEAVTGVCSIGGMNSTTPLQITLSPWAASAGFRYTTVAGCAEHRTEAPTASPSQALLEAGDVNLLSAEDQLAFAQLSAILRRDTWATCNTANAQACEVCPIETRARVNVDCETIPARRMLAAGSMQITALRFPNNGVRGEVPVSILSKFKHVRVFDFSSDPNLPNPNALSLARGVECVELPVCIEPGVMCNFSPLPLCVDIETPPPAFAVGWIITIVAILLAILLFVYVRRRRSTTLRTLQMRLSELPISNKFFAKEDPEYLVTKGPDMKWFNYHPEKGPFTPKETEFYAASTAISSDLEQSYRLKRRTGEFSFSQDGSEEGKPADKRSNSAGSWKSEASKDSGFQERTNHQLSAFEHVNLEY